MTKNDLRNCNSLGMLTSCKLNGVEQCTVMDLLSWIWKRDEE
jgi:hypothetical protein